MTHLRSHFADLLVTFVILVGQIPIAFLFWRKRRHMPLPLATVCSLALLFLWTAVLFASPYRFFVRYHMLEFVPYSTRNLLIAIGNTWGTLSVFSLAVYSLFWVFAGASKTSHSPGRRRLLQTAGAVAAGAPFAAGAFGAIVERTNFQIKEIDLPVPNLHPDFEGFRIGQLSDLHCSPWLSVRDAARVVDMLNEQKPHLTVVTGDLITEPGDPLDGAIREVGRLRADLGVLGCHGNHEIYVDCQEYASSELAKRGIRILRHETQEIRRGNGILNIAGIDYQSKRFAPYLIRGEELVRPGVANLLLSHNPDVFPTAVRKGFDAVLSGHTHGGQVTVEYLNQALNIARFATPYVAGLYRIDGRSCYVTAGIGTIALPVRLGAPPEITIARLVRA
jgi:uncharacterized protein